MCEVLGRSSFKNVKEKMQIFDNTHSLDLRVPLKRDNLEPICQVIKPRMNIRELFFTSCKLNDNSFSVLLPILPVLKSLRKLDFSCNFLTLQSLNLLSDKPPLELNSLSVNRNPLGKEIQLVKFVCPRSSPIHKIFFQILGERLKERLNSE